MPSKFDTKSESILDKVAQSAKARPWKRPLFWVAAAAFVLFATLKEVLEGLFETTENSSNSNTLSDGDPEIDVHGIKKGDPLYSRPGTVNPAYVNLYLSEN